MNQRNTSRRKKLIAAVAVILTATGGLLASAATANAATTPVPGPVTERDGSITIHKHTNPGFDTPQNPDGSGGIDGTPLNGVTFTVCRIDGIDLISGGNDAWEDVRALGVIAPTVTDTATEIGTFDLIACADDVTAAVNGVDGVAVFDDLDVGAYLVRETQAPDNIVQRAAPFIVTVPTPAIGTAAGQWLYDVNVYPKNQELDRPGKTIVEQAADTAVLGSHIVYEISQRLPGVENDAYTKVIITDQLDEKLDPVTATPVVVTLNGVALDAASFSAVWSGTDSRLLTVTFIDSALLGSLELGDEIVVQFAATANAPGNIVNTADVNINDLVAAGSPQRTTPEIVTRWGAVDLTKVNASAPAPFPGLADAEFELWMGATADPGCATATSGNVLAAANVVSSASGALGTVTSGVFTELPGLWVGDNSSTATDLLTRCYFLVETKAPAGFVLPANSADRTTEFIVHPQATAHLDATHAIENTQQEVPEMPLTGAAGQTLLVVAGVSLMALAVTMVLLKRRKTVEE